MNISIESSPSGWIFCTLVFSYIFLYIDIKEKYMELLLFFIEKFFVFTFALAVIYVVFGGIVPGVIKFIRAMQTGDYGPLSSKKLIWLAIALAHIITTLITGFIL